MAPDWPKRLTDLVRAAAPLRAAQRREFLDRECGGDTELRERVEWLLAAQDSATMFGGAGGPDSGATDAGEREGGPGKAWESPPARPTPIVIGGFRIKGVLGEGGMGVVYLAEQDRPRRSVALKVVRPGLLSAAVQRRFELESDLLARLQHPGIAQVYEAGTAQTEAGAQQYLAMECIRGEPLTAYAQAKSLDARKRLELFAKVCDAVQHAHTKGVIHRDLKPANILVTEEGEPKILDFGIARATDADVQSVTMQTGVGQLIGTLAYMSPEQLAGNSADLDTRSDVYTLGVVLYELLSGRLPHQVHGKTVAEAVRTIEESDPLPLGTVDRIFRGDMQTIVGKAMERERDRRYQSAAELGADILRFLHDEPIQARPASATYKIVKFARRNTGLVAAAACAAMLLAAGIGATSWQAARATRGWNAAAQRGEETRAALDQAQRERDNAEAINEFLSGMFASIEPDNALGREVSVREILDEAAKKVAAASGEKKGIEATLRQTIGRTYHSLGRLPEAEENYRISLELSRATLGEEDDKTLQAMRNYAGLLADMGKFDEAEKLEREAVATSERVKGKEAPDTALAQGELARILQEVGRYDEAETLMKEAMRVGLATLGPERPELLTVLHNYASSLKDRGRYAEAEKYLRDVLRLRIELHGEEHPQTAYTMNNLATTLQRLGKTDEAMGLYEKVVQIRLKTLGEDHPATLTAELNLGGAKLAAGDKAGAEPLLSRATEGMRRVLGDEHPKTIVAMGMMAYLYEDLGRDAEAESLYKRVVDVRRRVSGGKDPETWTSMNNLAMYYQTRGKPELAEPLYVEVLALCDKTLPPEHLYTALFRNNYGECLVDLGRFEEAEGRLLRSLAVLEAGFGPAHARTQKAFARMVKLYEGTGETVKAAAYREKIAKPAGAAEPGAAAKK